MKKVKVRLVRGPSLLTYNPMSSRVILYGMMIDGNPLRINLAIRRAKNPAKVNMHHSAAPVGATPLPINALGQIDYENVRDDRGNPATKNLFVAGYGPGTTEQELKNIFYDIKLTSNTIYRIIQGKLFSLL